MKKKINTQAIVNELQGSVFFPKKETEEQEHTSIPTPQPSSLTPDTVIPRHRDTIQPSNHDTTIPLNEEDLLETVRKAVKQVGKEAATQRLTLEEKQELVDIEYSYKRQGIKTSGNEIMRIATNYIVRDYRKNGEQSVLAKVLRKLNSWYHDTKHDTTVSWNQATTVQFTPWQQAKRYVHNSRV